MDRSPDKSHGLIAQEVASVAPEFVGVDERGYQTVDYEGLRWLQLQAVQELAQRVDELEASRDLNRRLESRVDTLEARLRQVESGLASKDDPRGHLRAAGPWATLGFVVTVGGVMIVRRRRRPR